MTPKRNPAPVVAWDDFDGVDLDDCGGAYMGKAFEESLAELDTAFDESLADMDAAFDALDAMGDDADPEPD